MKNVMHLTYSSSLSDITNNNSSFDSGVLRVAYHGANRNKSYISKETYEKCMESIYNCPIVCNYSREDDSIGSHDVELVSDENGMVKMINATTPVGVVPESAKPYWETVTEEDGSKHEYLCTDILLWKRQEAYEKIKKDGITGESMEITVKDGERDKSSGLYVINDFEFTAFCLLGDDVAPCFESASVEVFSYDKFKNEMELMMKDLKETYSMNTPHNVDEDANNHSTEGGEKFLEEEAIVNTESVETFSAEPEVQNIEEENHEEAESFELSGDNSLDNTEVNSDEDAGNKEFELNSNLSDSLYKTLESEKVERPWGVDNRYYMIDFDADNAIVYYTDCVDRNMYGSPYSVDGDNVSVDYGCKKRMKWAIVEYVDGAADPIGDNINNMFEAIQSGYDSKIEKANEEYSNNINAANEEISVLIKYKEDKELEQLNERKMDILSKFSELDGIDAFDEIKNNLDSYDVEILEEKCFAIKGRNVSSAKFSLDSKPVRVVVDNDESGTNEPYGGLFVKYGTDK